MSAVESVEKRLTKTTLESFRCNGLFKSNIHRAVLAFEFGTTARRRIRIALRHNSASAAASFLCPGARQSNAVGQLLAGWDIGNSRIATLYVLAKFSSTPTPSGS